MRATSFGRTALALCATVFSLAACSGMQPVRPVTINLVAINDLHGHLEATSKSFTGVGDASPRKIKAGGIDTIGGALNAWRAEDPQLLLVGAGDLIGASPALSSIWADEPTIAALNQLQLRVSSVGNHEFDQGTAELLRDQQGGCHSNRPDKACHFAPQFSGARFSYLTANVIGNASGQPLLPPYRIEQVRGLKIGFIGGVVRETEKMVSADGIASVHFTDEADAINRWVPELKAQGVSAIVVLIHQGGETSEPFDKTNCQQLRGPIVDIVKRLDPAIRLVISAHTHNGYTCQVDGRTVTQGDSFGHMLTRITLTVDPGVADLAGKITAINARNVLMDPQRFTADPALASFLQQLQERSNVILAQPIARIAVPHVDKQINDAGESPLGDLIADSQLAATRKLGARIALINHKSLRENLESDAGGSNYAQVAATTPYGNTLVLMNLSGSQILALLEQQSWLEEDRPGGRIMLQVSHGFSYRWDARQPLGQRVVRGSVKLDGVALEPQKQYRVSVNSFIAQGGDGFSLLTQGSERIDTGINDLDALSQYLIASERDGHPAGSVQTAGRILRLH
ncbi:bifunctional metallophosphatase/5'-nucleotidase [Collimonas pratensis]|uniref:Calcineurin-like phosphoesterase family protein n=1 Tax=Collimonas pratensis TaxID=279113 RepID=A0A127QCL3_9BURK|nr:bifunctional metallophosphatase/5'-nucleotidase [Collimonas pratensis]AMP07372.1 calcineurin-like phosphoesterase family protein [Collimonas pratensis]